MKEKLENLVAEMIERRILLEEAMDEFEKRFIQTVLSKTKGNQTRAAEALGVHRNTLNRKQYSNSGSLFSVKTKIIEGEEYSQPGSTSPGIKPFRKVHNWLTLRVLFDNYFNSHGLFRAGLHLEGLASTQGFFNNYTASILSAPAFQPTPESKTIFLESYRAHQFLAGGIKTLFNIRNNFDLRVESYVFLPYRSIGRSPDLRASYGSVFSNWHYIATVAAVYQTPLGPLSISVNYYDKRKESFSLLFHFGYILFNERAIE